jgi:hypothetical protein
MKTSLNEKEKNHMREFLPRRDNEHTLDWLRRHQWFREKVDSVEVLFKAMCTTNAMTGAESTQEGHGSVPPTPPKS